MWTIGASGGPFLPQAPTTAASASAAVTRSIVRRLTTRPRPARRALSGAAPHLRRLEPPHVDRVVAHLVVEDALGGVEQSRRLGAIAARRLQRVLDQIALVGGDRVLERDAGDGAGGIGGLQRRRQVMAV